MLALTGVAGASPHHGAGVDGRDGRGRHHQARNEARHDRADAADANHDRSRGAAASPEPKALRSAQMAPVAGTPTAPAALAPAAPPVVTPAVVGSPVVVKAAQRSARALFRGGPSRVIPIGPKPPALRLSRATPVAGAGSAPWYLSLGAGLPLSSAFGHGELRAVVRLSLPIALAGIVLVFLILQAQIDKRDPKLTEAPIRRSDDGMSFE
jgi:hypothetical protein